MMSLHTLGQRMQRDLGGVLERCELNTGTVIFRWNAAPPPADRNLESTYSAPEPQSETVPGLIHYVSVRAAERGFAEFQAGDAIVTFGADVDIASKRGLFFTLPDGKDYVQAATGKKVMEFWDAFIAGQPLSVTLLLRLKG